MSQIPEVPLENNMAVTTAQRLLRECRTSAEADMGRENFNALLDLSLHVQEYRATAQVEGLSDTTRESLMMAATNAEVAIFENVDENFPLKKMVGYYETIKGIVSKVDTSYFPTLKTIWKNSNQNK